MHAFASYIDFDENVVFVPDSHELNGEYCASSFKLCAHGSLKKPRCVESEDYCYEGFAFFRHSFNLKFDLKNMIPEKVSMAPRNAGLNPRTMNMEKSYQEADRVSDKKSLMGTERPFIRHGNFIGDDDEWLAMRQGDMPPPVPE